VKVKKIFGRTFFDLSGSLHVHTEDSFDSCVPLKKVEALARKYDIDFVTINDHFSFAAKTKRNNNGDLLPIIIIGAEISDKNNLNHYLVFNTNQIKKNISAADYVTEYHAEGAYGFIAHPVDKRVNYSIKDYPWVEWNVNVFNGLEIWNYVSSWLRWLDPRKNGLFWVLFPSLFVRKPFRDILNIWDKLTSQGLRKAAIGSIDAHTIVFKKFGINFRFLRHRQLMQTIRTNVLIEDTLKICEESILQALVRGNSYVVNYRVSNPYDFYCGISDGKKSALPGESISISNNLKLYFRLPKTAKVILMRDGKKRAQKFDTKGFFEIDSVGSYRLEIVRFGYGWIYTNNIYVEQ